MKLIPIKHNCNEIVLDDGLRVLFSYQTPVAAIVMIGGLQQAVKTEKKWSNTTTRHIKQWAGTFPSYLNNWDTKPQEYFNALISGVC